MLLFQRVVQKSEGFKAQLSLALWVALFVILVGPGLLQLESGQTLAGEDDGGMFCTRTARAALRACR